MKSLVLVILFLFASTAIAQDNVIELRNADVLSMIAAKVPADAIVKRIQTSRCNFDTFPTVISELRYKGVPEEILTAMMEAPVGRPTRELPKEGATPSEKRTTDTVGPTDKHSDEAQREAAGKAKDVSEGSAQKTSTETVKNNQSEKLPIPIAQPPKDVTESLEKPKQQSPVEQKVFTNDDVLKLLRGGSATGDVAAQIKNARGNYDFSAQALHALQEAGADGLVFVAMMEVSRRRTDSNKKSEDPTPKP